MNQTVTGTNSDFICLKEHKTTVKTENGKQISKDDIFWNLVPANVNEVVFMVFPVGWGHAGLMPEVFGIPGHSCHAALPLQLRCSTAQNSPTSVWKKQNKDCSIHQQPESPSTYAWDTHPVRPKDGTFIWRAWRIENTLFSKERTCFTLTFSTYSQQPDHSDRRRGVVCKLHWRGSKWNSGDTLVSQTDPLTVPPPPNGRRVMGWWCNSWWGRCRCLLLQK